MSVKSMAHVIRSAPTVPEVTSAHVEIGISWRTAENARS